MRSENVIAVALLLSGGFLSCSIPKKNATYSCTAALTKQLEQQGQVTTAPTQEWRILDLETTATQVFPRVENSDCAPMLKWKTFSPSNRYLVDPWGNPLAVAISSDPQGKVHFRVWSFGPDGSNGTSDDIGITPTGARTP